MTQAPKKRMRKPYFCDACRKEAWPAFGIGCPCFYSERPPSLRDVYLWHCGAVACEAECRARYAAKLRELGRIDLAEKLEGKRKRAAPPRAPVKRPARAVSSPPKFQKQDSLF